MIRKSWMLSLCAVSLTCAATAFALQGEKGTPEKGKPQEGAMTDMMGAKPTQEHKVLEQMVGTWSAAMQFPGMDDMKGQGTETSEMAMNGLWLVGDFEMADFMGAPFRGHSLTGYDSKKQKYVGVWVDSMTDRVTLSEGEYDRAKNQLVMHAENLDHMTGKMVKERHVTEFRGPDTRVFKMIPEGSDQPSMIIEYTRKK